MNFARVSSVLVARGSRFTYQIGQQYGRYSYRKIAALLRVAGWPVNDKRVERIWQREGLKVRI